MFVTLLQFAIQLSGGKAAEPLRFCCTRGTNSPELQHESIIGT